MTHTCHWPGCDRRVPPKLWGCREHWFALPRAIREEIWRTYRPGQEADKAPSRAYLTAARAAQDYARAYDARTPTAGRDLDAITVWQPWASLIVAGLKRFEWRTWPAPKTKIGQRLVIHAGSHRISKTEFRNLLCRPEPSCGPDADADGIRALLADGLPSLPFGAGVGEVTLGTPRTAPEIDPDPRSDPGKWGWPMLDPVAWDAPVPARGAQGFFRFMPSPVPEPHPSAGGDPVAAVMGQLL